MCLKSRQQWQKAAPREGFNIPDPFFTRCFFSLWTGHKELSAGVRSGRGWMAGAGSSPHAGLLQPAMENRLGCMHSCGACSHYDDRAHSIFLLCVLFTAGWSWHCHSTEKVRNSSLRATKLFYTSARIKVKWLQEDKKTARLHLTAAGCTQASWQSLQGLGCFDKTEPRKNPQGRNFPRVSGQSHAGTLNLTEICIFHRAFKSCFQCRSSWEEAESCDPSTEASVMNKSNTQYLAIWSLKHFNSETAQNQHYSQAASLLLQRAKFWSFEYWEEEMRPGAGWKASLDVCWHLQQHEVCAQTQNKGLWPAGTDRAKQRAAQQRSCTHLFSLKYPRGKDAQLSWFYSIMRCLIDENNLLWHSLSDYTLTHFLSVNAYIWGMKSWVNDCLVTLERLIQHFWLPHLLLQKGWNGCEDKLIHHTGNKICQRLKTA